MPRKHHHVVSRGYQRFFADGEHIMLIDKVTMKARAVGTHDAFARKHFCSYLADGAWSDEIEDEWRRIEAVCLPEVRRLVAGARDVDPVHIKALAAVHYVRNYAFVAKFDQIFGEMFATAPAEIAGKEAAQAAFEADFGRPALPGEIDEMVAERFLELEASRAMLIQQMGEGFNTTMDLLAPFHVQLVWPLKADRDFVLGDVPLVHTAKDGRIGALGGVALGDADRAFLPLSPRLAVLFTTRPFAHCPLTREQVEMLNRDTWRCAMRLVAAHPSTHIKRSTGQWTLDVAPRRVA